MTFVLNKYPNISKTLFLPKYNSSDSFFIVTVIWIIVCVDSTRVFQYKWDSWHPILVSQTLHNSLFDASMWKVDANGQAKGRAPYHCCVIVMLVSLSCQIPPPLAITQCWYVQMCMFPPLPPMITQSWDVQMGHLPPHTCDTSMLRCENELDPSPTDDNPLLIHVDIRQIGRASNVYMSRVYM